MQCPSPGQPFRNHTTIASSYGSDEFFVILSLSQRPPHFHVGQYDVDGGGIICDQANAYNIVDAVQLYVDFGGDPGPNG